MIDSLSSLNPSSSDNLNNQASLLAKELILTIVSVLIAPQSRFHHTVLLTTTTISASAFMDSIRMHPIHKYNVYEYIKVGKCGCNADISQTVS